MGVTDISAAGMAVYVLLGAIVCEDTCSVVGDGCGLNVVASFMEVVGSTV